MLLQVIHREKFDLRGVERIPFEFLLLHSRFIRQINFLTRHDTASPIIFSLRICSSLRARRNCPVSSIVRPIALTRFFVQQRDHSSRAAFRSEISPGYQRYFGWSMKRTCVPLWFISTAVSVRFNLRSPLEQPPAVTFVIRENRP